MQTPPVLSPVKDDSLTQLNASDPTALNAGFRLRSIWKMRTPLLPSSSMRNGLIEIRLSPAVPRDVALSGPGHVEGITVRLFFEETHGTNRGAFGDLIPLESQKNLDVHDFSETFRRYPPPPRLPALLALASTRCPLKQSKHRLMHNAPLCPVLAWCVAVRRWPSQPS